jgi:hypothetical protein
MRERKGGRREGNGKERGEGGEDEGTQEEADIVDGSKQTNRLSAQSTQRCQAAHSASDEFARTRTKRWGAKKKFPETFRETEQVDKIGSSA